MKLGRIGKVNEQILREYPIGKTDLRILNKLIAHQNRLKKMVYNLIIRYMNLHKMGLVIIVFIL